MNTFYIRKQERYSREKMLRAFFTCFILLSFFGLSAQQWQYLGAQDGISAGGASFNNLAKDSAGNIYVSYYDVSVTKGSVQKYDGTAWTYAGGTAGITNGFATYNSLCADASGNVYYTNQGTGMEVRKFNGTAWSVLPSVTSNTINFQSSAVTPNGTLVAANNEASGTVKRLVNGAWEQVGSTGFAGGVPYYLDMVTGSDNTVYVSFVSGGNINVMKNNVTAGSSTLWTYVGGAAVAPATSSEQYRAALAIDASDNIYVAYTSLSASGNKINVKKFNGTAWSQVGAENFSEYRVHYVNIAVSPTGVPYVVFSNFENSPNNKNSVMKFNGSGWETVGDNPVAASEAKWNAIIFDNAGNPVIAYTDSGSGKTIVRKFAAATAVPVQSISVATQNSVPAAISANDGTLQLTSSVLPATADQAVTWSITQGSQNAAITQGGLVTASENGSITVTATSVQDPAKTATIVITITNQTAAGTGNGITGFNRDIIANGVGNASASSEIGLDEVNSRALVSLDFKATSSSPTPAYGLPANGLITSAATPAITYQLANYTGPNALYLTPSYVTGSINTVSSGTLSFQAQNVGKVYVLSSAAGGGSTNLPFTATVNFSDASMQVVTLQAKDWYSGTGYAAKGIGRVNRTNNNLEGDAENPRLYENVITILDANTAKTITGITFSFDGDATAEYGEQIRLAILSVATAAPSAVTAPGLVVKTSAGQTSATIDTNSDSIDLDAYQNDLYVADNDITWSIVPGGTGTASIGQYGVVTAVANGTVIIRATLISDPSVHGDFVLTITGQQAGYCDAYLINGCSNLSISSVVTTGGYPNLNNATTGCLGTNNLNGYNDYTVQTLGAAKNSTVTFNFNFTGSLVQFTYLSVYIDWNHDMIFSQDETVYLSTTEESTGVLQFTVNVPSTAILGNTRMRCKAVSGFIGSGPCGYNSQGEVEDYTINILAEGAVPGVTVVTQNSVPAVINTNDGTLQLVANTTPTTGAPVTWSVVAGNIFATVDANGLVSAEANGTVTVRAALVSDPTLKHDIIITITNQIIDVTAIDVVVQNNAPAVITANEGTLQLNALVSPVNATNTAVTWTIVSGSEFASIDENGLVTAVANGTVTLRATSNEDETLFDEIAIVISNQYVAATALVVSVQDDAEPIINTNVGTLQLVATIAPAEATNADVTWTIVSGAEFASIDENGLVTANANGTIMIRATSNDDEMLFDEIEIVISNQYVAATALIISVENDAEPVITTNEGTLQLVATIAPADATDASATWTIVSGAEFASIDENGLVTAVANGTVTVRATSNDDETLFDEIAIAISNQYVAATALIISVENDAEPVINTNESTLQLVATIVPAEATNADVTWTIVNGAEFASIDENGLVTAVANGTVIVRATSNDDETIYDEIEVVINVPTAGLGDFDASKFVLYPNPSNGVVTIQSSQVVKEIAVFTMTGQLVYKGTGASVDISAQQEGIYLVKVTLENGAVATQKLIRR
ncbi:Ig-like domain-containing protein [Flavobacterium sp. DG1-102-2]|uniref:Ig-like domain-containing protein n=1 Tax=Flavobacterium sp. DG1-102-2 TaxID=3081663 RepID=UPI00294A2480|nr:Ig-like domain-containing protein [Flavobacterium sp. DG1-102-2]MDV6169826.1 Ig-like domain-containing protein [Flavobacterium sp. DG1-102-2]